MSPRGRSMALLTVVLAIGVALYVAAGVMHAYLAADDFQWLSGAHSFTWSRVLQVDGDRFYRPVIDLWFAGAVSACGPAIACYHGLNLGLHLLTVTLVFSLALRVFRDARIAFWSALFFAVEPAYTQAVVWVSGVTSLLATCLYVAALVAQAASWEAATRARRTAAEFTAVVAAAGALLSHEAAITLPVVSWIMWKQFGPEPLTRRRMLAAGLALAVGAFVVVTFLANDRNSVLSGSHYAIGVHMVRHALDYLVALYVGPSWWLAWAACGAAIAGLLAATPVTRFGAVWLLVTVVPYTGFTWGNVSRYHYLPSIGFALAVAAAVIASGDWVSRRAARHRQLVQVGVLLLATFVAVRFVTFDYASVRSQVGSLEPWREYAGRLAADVSPPVAGRVHIGPSLASDLVDPMYLEPMLRWLRQDFTLQVVVDRPEPNER